jgi:hypothetical protein
MTATNLHTVETQPLAAEPPPVTHLLTGAHAEAVMRLVTLTLEAARKAGDEVTAHVDASPDAIRIEILVAHR